MVFRLIVSLLALFTVCAFVYCELALSYAGVLMGRDAVYSAVYDALLSSSLDETVWDSFLTVVIYTLPECFAVLVLYHLYTLFGRSMGMAPSEQRPGD